MANHYGEMLSRTTPTPQFLSSQLSSQLRLPPPHGDGATNFGKSGTDETSAQLYAVRTPSKSRSLSDSTPKLSPSPKIKESRRESKDDHAVPTNPKTPRRPEFLARGLSLQMPPREVLSPASASLTKRVPLSPQLDVHDTYASPAQLPRHSRGLDFSRACSNLHQTTLARHQSPDSSPTMTQKGLTIPRRGTMSAMTMDSPSLGSGPSWALGNEGERTAISSSLGSINMLGSESSSDSSDGDDMMDDNDDAILTTPHVEKAINITATTPFTLSSALSPGGPWPNPFVPSANFMNYQRARLRHGRSRKSSSSASAQSSMASPSPASPPPGKVIDSNGYFPRDVTMKTAPSRRESLTMGTNELHISSGNDSGDEAPMRAPSTPGVIRRAVTRRGNLLPKTKTFARIKAALIEESAPLETEFRREAEVFRQVRENETEVDPLQPITTQSSPTLAPSIPGVMDPLEGVSDINPLGLDVGPNPQEQSYPPSFLRQASKNSGSKEFWNNFDNRMRTPPPSFPRDNSISDDMSMDSPLLTTSNSVFAASLPKVPENVPALNSSRASTPQPSQLPTQAEITRKVNKRRRDDDLDPASFKRRAVSPGLSVHNSPILSQSPGQRESGWWGGRPREGSLASQTHGERSNSGSSMTSTTPTLGPKRMGLQGMVDTNDGLMKMTID